ncbi:hypothetical protein AB2980_22085, partial [Staphylococcus aureus]
VTLKKLFNLNGFFFNLKGEKLFGIKKLKPPNNKNDNKTKVGHHEVSNNHLRPQKTQNMTSVAGLS